MRQSLSPFPVSSRPVSSFEALTSCAGAAFFGKDVGGWLGPSIRFGECVVTQEVVIDRLLQFGDAGEHAAPDALVRDLGKEALDEVQP